MIRLSTCVTVMLAWGSGLYLYQTKHQAQVLDRQIEHTVKAIAATRMQSRELAASWTVLGSPDRLQQLSDQFIGIKSVQPSQFVAIADLDSRLPAPRAPDAPSSATPGDTGSETTPIPATEPSAAPDTPTTPAPASRAAPATASPAPVAADAARASSVAAARPAEHKPSETLRPAREAAQSRPAAPRAASPASPVVAELERPARPAPQPLAPAPVTGSLLGMAHIAVRAPVPLPVSTAPSAPNGN